MPETQDKHLNIWLFWLQLQLSSKKNGDPSDVLDTEFQQEIKPSEATAQDDIFSVYTHMTTNMQLDPKKVIIFGRSLGTGPSCFLAAKLSAKKENVPAGLILQSPFLSAIRVVLKTPFTLPIDIFPNLSNITRVKFPILIIHGTQDRVINVEHGRQLSTKVPDTNMLTKIFIDGAGHNDIESRYWPQFSGIINEFLDKLDGVVVEVIEKEETFWIIRFLSNLKLILYIVFWN